MTSVTLCARRDSKCIQISRLEVSIAPPFGQLEFSSIHQFYVYHHLEPIPVNILKFCMWNKQYSSTQHRILLLICYKVTFNTYKESELERREKEEETIVGY